MTPYRSRREERPVAAPTTGLVADMVRQFADPYAFLRELVQNGIDAGAAALSVTVAIEPGGLVSTSVEDDGSGMTLAVIEEELLTLFSSSKEGDLSKIGKYGVGFVSVLALAPEEVRVETWCGGRAFLLRLARDHRYTVEEAAPRDGSGTKVTVLTRTGRDELGAHVDRARAALRRWCRHAERPIRLSVADRELGGPGVDERIDEPLGVHAPCVLVTTIEGERYAVGPSAGSEHLEGAAGSSGRPRTFAGFYNRGLTLFETEEEAFPGIAGVRFKVVSPHLSHTLSRDNVRRDAAFERALARVAEIVRGPLRSTVANALREAAREAAAGVRAHVYAALLEAALSPPILLDPAEITFPLTDPLWGVETALADVAGLMPGREAPILSHAPSTLTAALAQTGRPVVRCVHPAVAPLVRRCFPRVIVSEARLAWMLAREVPARPVSGAGRSAAAAGSGASRSAATAVSGDAALCAEVARALGAVGVRVSRVALASVESGAALRTAIAAPDNAPELPQLVAVDGLEEGMRRLDAWGRLLLDVARPEVRAARARAAEDPLLAGQLLARAILVEARGTIDARANDRLLALAGEAPA